MFVRSIAKGSNYRIRALWISARIYNLSFHSFFSFFCRGEGERIEERRSAIFIGKEAARFEVIH